MSRNIYPSDEAAQRQFHFTNRLYQEGAIMRDPHWKTDHPTAGQSGVKYVWRFGDVGVVAQTKVGGSGWEVFQVRFNGVEINNYTQTSDRLENQTPAQIEELLQSFDPKVVEVEAVEVKVEEVKPVTVVEGDFSPISQDEPPKEAA